MRRLVATDNFSLAVRDKFDRTKLLFDIANVDGQPHVLGRRPPDAVAIAERAERRNAEARRDPGATWFFSGAQHFGPVVSPVVASARIMCTEDGAPQEAEERSG